MKVELSCFVVLCLEIYFIFVFILGSRRLLSHHRDTSGLLVQDDYGKIPSHEVRLK